MTEDINACMRGLNEAGVDKIYVLDCHGNSYSVLWDEISDDTDYVISGDDGEGSFVDIEGCDAIVLLGYHAMAGTFGAMLLPPNKAHELLKQKAKKTVSNFKNMKPYTIANPVEITVELVEISTLPKMDANDGLEHTEYSEYDMPCVGMFMFLLSEYLD